MGQSSETIEDIKELVKKKTGCNVTVIDIETIDTEDPDYAAVVKLFDAYSVWALPVITIDGKVVCWGAVDSDRIEAALDNALEASA